MKAYGFRKGFESITGRMKRNRKTKDRRAGKRYARAWVRKKLSLVDFSLAFFFSSKVD